ncbi:hypothetical protein [Desulfurococcus amylolyticus]|nr:hypothetical protein [Desulfurococcus amylolyticus]
MTLNLVAVRTQRKTNRYHCTEKLIPLTTPNSIGAVEKIVTAESLAL